MTGTILRSITVTVLLLGTLKAHQTAEAMPPPGDSCCTLVEDALKAFSAIHVGAKRADVEQNFTEAGGLSFGSQMAYVYKKCPYIKMTVTFTYANGVTQSPVDVVNKVSQLSIEYEVKD